MGHTTRRPAYSPPRLPAALLVHGSGGISAYVVEWIPLLNAMGIALDGFSTSAAIAAGNVRFSNRPFRVKRFQTIHHYSVDVAHGLVLLYGIGTKAVPSWGSRRGGTIFWATLPSDER